jgi:hypothetical protein
LTCARCVIGDKQRRYRGRDDPRKAWIVRRSGAPSGIGVRVLVHRATLYRGKWQSVCGYDFLSYEMTSYEMTTEPHVITCVWCVAGISHGGSL